MALYDKPKDGVRNILSAAKAAEMVRFEDPADVLIGVAVDSGQDRQLVLLMLLACAA